MGSFESLPPVEIPADLGERIARRLDKADWEAKQTRKAPFGWLRLGLVGVTAGALLVVGVKAGYIVSGGKTVEPTSVVKKDGTYILQVIADKATHVLISLGGVGSGMPPQDSVQVRRETAEAGTTLSMQLEDRGGPKEIVYASTDNDNSVTAVIFPGTKTAPEGLLRSLTDISTRHGIVIEVKVSSFDNAPGAVALSSDLDKDLQAALGGTPYRYVIEGKLVRIR
jgi:hypothetical protein